MPSATTDAAGYQAARNDMLHFAASIMRNIDAEARAEGNYAGWP